MVKAFLLKPGLCGFPDLARKNKHAEKQQIDDPVIGQRHVHQHAAGKGHRPFEGFAIWLIIQILTDPFIYFKWYPYKSMKMTEVMSDRKGKLSIFRKSQG